MIVELLAVLSASAAAGMRIALPLLVIGLLRSDELWSNVPLLSCIHPSVLLGILTVWSLLELFGSKKLLGQRVLQLVQLIFSPVVGALMGITVARLTEFSVTPTWSIAMVGGLLALFLKLVEIGWFFRLRGLPVWAVFAEDILCVFLVILALKAPQQGGSIAIFLFWLAIRSSREWRKGGARKKHPEVKD